MIAVDFLLSNELELPKLRNIPDFETYLAQIFDDFLNLLGQVQGNDAFSQIIGNQVARCTQLCSALRTALRRYLEGFPHAAYQLVDQAIAGIAPFFNALMPPANMTPELQYLYRVRTSTVPRTLRREVFHVPFDAREHVATQRYSIPGLPCLYLGGSVWVCWKELRGPATNEIYLSRFRATPPAGSTIRVVNFGHRPAFLAGYANHSLQQGVPTPNEIAFVTAQTVCWPIIAACSIKALHPDGKFKVEYVFPQIILQWVRMNHDYDGLRYFSTHLDDHLNDPRGGLNYVFPARTLAAQDFCAHLAGHFELSSPLSWQAALNLAAPAAPIPYMNFSIPDASGAQQQYINTDFGRVQARVAGQMTGAVL